MKNEKRIAFFALLLGAAVIAAGCGTKKEKASAVTPAVTVTPTPTPEPEDEGSLIEMEQTEDEDSKYDHVIGNKTNGSVGVVIINQLNDEIAALYVRPVYDSSDNDDTSWGDELIQGEFTLKSSKNVMYYFEPVKSGNRTITSYDIRVSFKDEGKNEYFFRNLPLTTIKELRLCKTGSQDGTIPYARYTTTTGNRTYSTLEEVRRRLGLDDEDDEDDEDEEDLTPTPTPSPGVTATPTPMPQVDQITNVPDQGATQAARYIGQSIGTLIGAIGDANSSSYEDEPETGRTGYYYYDTFTVSTAVDDEGNEVVAGVW